MLGAEGGPRCGPERGPRVPGHSLPWTARLVPQGRGPGCGPRVFMTWGALTARAGLCDSDTRSRAGPRDPRRGARHSLALLPADTMPGPRRPGPRAGRGRASDCSPCRGPRLDAPDRGLWDPTAPARCRPRSRTLSRPRSRTLSHSRSRSRRPLPPARPRNPTPRSGRRRAALPGPRCRRPGTAAQCAARPGPVTPGNRRTRDGATRGEGTGPLPGEHGANRPPPLRPWDSRPPPRSPGPTLPSELLTAPYSRPAQPYTSGPRLRPPTPTLACAPQPQTSPPTSALLLPLCFYQH